MKRLTKEEVAELQAQRQAQRLADEAEAMQLLASPAGAALLRYLRGLWARRGLGKTAEATAYRVGLRDAVEVLEDMRKDGGA